MDAGSLSWLDDFLKNFGNSKVEQAGNILSRFSPVLGGAAAARNTQENTQIGQLLAQERLKQIGPATRLATGIRASVAKNAQPVTNNFRPGTGQAVKFSGGLTPEALGQDARQLADQVMHQTITDQLAGDTVPQITESGPLDKALGIGSTIAGIGGALTAKSPQQQIVQSILDRLKPTPPPNYGDVGSTTSVPDPGPDYGNATVPDPAMLAGGPAASYGVDSATQAALPGAVDLGSELPGLIDYGSQTTVPELAGAGAGAGAAGQAGQSTLSRLGGPIPIISGITSAIANKDPMMGVADFILPGLSSVINLLGMREGGQHYAEGYGYGPGLTPPPAGSAVDTGASSSVLDDNGNPIFTEGNTNLKTAKEAMDAGFSNDPTQGY